MIGSKTLTALSASTHLSPHGVSLTGSRTLRLAVASALGLAAVATRLPGAIAYSFWQDEVASARVIIEPTLGTMFGQVMRTESTPPAWYAIGWLFHEAGASPYGYRFSSVAFGGLLAAATFVLARRWLDVAGAALATIPVVFGYQFVSHGSELRAYELYALLSVLFALTLLAALESPTRRRLAWLAACVAAGALTNYFFLLMVATAVVVLWLPRTAYARSRQRISIAVVLGLLPFVAWLPFMARQYSHHRFAWIGAFSWHQVLSTYWLLLARIDPQTAVLHNAAPILVTVIVLVSVAVMVWRGRDDERLVALLSVVPLVIASVVWAAGPQVFDTRNVLSIGPFAGITVVAAFSRVERGLRVPIAIGAVALLLYGFATFEGTTPADYQRVAANLVAAGWTPEDPIVLYGNFFAFRSPLEWYLPDRPHLTLAVAHRRRCPQAFVVAVGDLRGKRMAHKLHLAGVAAVTQITTGRLPIPERLSGRRWVGAKIISSVEPHAFCVRPLSENGLVRP